MGAAFSGALICKQGGIMAGKSITTEEDQKNATARRASGEFVRGLSGFRHWLDPDGDFPPEADRYHLYVALNCPWCHRVTLARNILGLQDTLSMSVAFPTRTGDSDPAGPNLWEFNPDRISPITGAPLPECTDDTGSTQNFRLAAEIYAAEGASEKSVPILYDKRTERVVSNESAEIIRMLNAHAAALGSKVPIAQRPDLYPESTKLRVEIDTLNSLTYTAINNGAYKAGFSSRQDVYEEAYTAYFSALQTLEDHLSADNQPFLMGEHFTEADLRLFPTLYRHDPVYYIRMKLNGAKILDYPHLWRWLCRVYNLPGVADSSSLIHCRQGYFGRSWNNVIPLGPNKPITYPEAYLHPELARDER